MDSNKILKSDYLDILFEGRNKAYGGYELRRTYTKRVGKALGVIGLIGLLTAGYYVYAGISKGPKKEVLNMKEVTLAEPPPVDPNQPPPPPPPPAPPPPVKPTVAFTPPVIKKDEEVKEDEKPPEQTKMEDKAISTVTQEGDPNGIDPGLVDSKGTGVVEATPAPTVFEFVEQQAEFNGNVQKFLSDNINYPEEAKQNQIEGRVVLRFIVNEDGTVTDVKVLRGIGSGCDEEAIRVVKKMSGKWKPGKNNGHAVRSYFTQPITFRLE